MKRFSLDHLTETEFEEFCFDLLGELGFINIQWRKGTGLSTSPSDRGRDIQCQRQCEDIDGYKYLETWFVECKHSTKGVPPDKLLNAMMWAWAERPDKLLIIASNFLSNSAHDCLTSLERNQRPTFKIKTWQKPDLEKLTAGKTKLLKKYKIVSKLAPSSESSTVTSPHIQSAPVSVSIMAEETGAVSQSSIYSISNYVPSVDEHFVGREQIISELIEAVKTTRMIALLGLPGIGKTALMKQVASHFESHQVFWYRFEPGLLSISDLLLHLAKFLDVQPGNEEGLAEALRLSELPERPQIEWLIRKLNQSCYYLFFDSVHHIEENQAFISFFCLLKEGLQAGAALVASRSIPVFYTANEEAKGTVKAFELEGLSDSEVEEFFTQNGFFFSEDMIQAITNRFGGLPLAVELMATLATNDLTDEELLALTDDVEDQTVDQLFQEVYERLQPIERQLLKLASLFAFSFSRNQLLSAHQAIFAQGDEQDSFIKLKRQYLIRRVAPDLYEVHEIIRSLVFPSISNLNETRIQLADYLADKMGNDFGAYLEAILLYFQAEAFDRASELAVPLIDTTLIPYYPDLAETLLSGFEERIIKPENWVWVVGSLGILANFWQQYDKAEECFQTMLRLAKTLQDKYAIAVALLRLGNIYRDRDTEIAETYYRDSLRIKEELGDIVGQAHTYSNLGSLYVDNGRFEDARSLLDKGLHLLEEPDIEDRDKLSLYANLGHLYAAQGQWQEADRFTRIALQLAERMELLYDVAKLTYNLGWHQEHQRNLEAARRLYQNALDIAETHGFWKAEKLAQTGLGKLYYEIGDYDNAIVSFERVAEILEQFDDKDGLAGIYFDIGIFYLSKKDFQAASEYHQKGLFLFEHISSEGAIRIFLTNTYILTNHLENPKQIINALKQAKKNLRSDSPSYALAKIYGVLGDIYQNILCRDRVALSCILQEVSLLDQLGYEKEKAEALMDLGIVYEELGRYNDVLTTYTKAIELARKLYIPNIVSIAFYNRGNCFAELEMWQQAEEDYRQSLSLAEQSGNSQTLEAARHNLGEVYRRQGRLRDAIGLLLSSLTSSRERGDVDDEIRTLNNLGLAYQATSENQEALDCFNKTLDLSRQYNLKQEEINVLISLGNFYVENDSPDGAKEYYEQALITARLIANAELEEDSMISLAWLHRRLGTFDNIAQEFEIVAKRAEALGHDEFLVDVSIFCGETNLQEGEFEPAVKMFDQAFMIAVHLLGKRILRKQLHDGKSSGESELSRIFGRILAGLDKAVEERRFDQAKAFYEQLFEQIRQQEYWGDSSPLILNYLEPIGNYLATLPPVPFLDYVQDAWRNQNNKN